MVISNIELMAIELTRLGLGLLLLLFHRQIADYVVTQERTLVVLFRSRGVPVPAAPTTETARNIYFGIGAFVAIYQLARIWVALHP